MRLPRPGPGIGHDLTIRQELACALRILAREGWRENLSGHVTVATAPGSSAGAMLRTFRRSHPGIDIADYLIAATADVGGLGLVTLNVKHFPMVSDLRPAF